jgi:hypothetical protein
MMDWASRRVLSWRISITLDSTFYIAAVEEAIARFGHPEIFKTRHTSSRSRCPQRPDHPAIHFSKPLSLYRKAEPLLFLYQQTRRFDSKDTFSVS